MFACVTETVAVLRAHGQTNADMCANTMDAICRLAPDEASSEPFMVAGVCEGQYIFICKY